MKNIKKLLEQYYHLSDKNLLTKSVIYDFFMDLFGIGSGLFTSVLRGYLFKIFLKIKSPFLIGKRFKIVNSFFFEGGNNVWIKDDVSLALGGPLKIGNRSVLCERVAIWSNEKGVEIGNDFALGIGSYLCGSGDRIKIGDEVRIADYVRMYTFNHNYEKKNIPVSKQGNTTGEIVIKNNVWIGSGAVILAGVTIGNNSVIAAGAVVNKDVPGNVLVGGIPAKIIKRIKLS